MPSLVFDVGGTKTRAGLFDSSTSSLLRAAITETPNHLDFPDASFDELLTRLLDGMSRVADEVVEGTPVTSINVGFAGPVAPNGNVLAAPTIWGARNGPPDALRKGLARRWPHARVGIMNDVTAAGYRYLSSPDDEFCIVTVSSGIGNKIFVNGRPLVGRSGQGGELGHLLVDTSDDAPLCECGGRGHLGAVSSGRAALEYARKCLPVRTSADLAAAFRRAEPWAVEVIEHVAAPLGWALAAMHMAIGVSRFVLIGGFALALGEPYRRLVARAAGARCWQCAGDWPAMVELGVDDDLSGLLGAGRAGSFQHQMP